MGRRWGGADLEQLVGDLWGGACLPFSPHLLPAPLTPCPPSPLTSCLPPCPPALCPLPPSPPACLPALCSPHPVPGCLQVRLVDVHAGAEARMEGHEAAQTKLKVMIHQLESQLKVSAGPL